MQEPTESHFASPLRDAIEASFNNGVVDPGALFTNWFRRGKGVPYFFLFKKNLSCTNLQFAELFALLRVHTSAPLKDRQQLSFVTLSEFLAEVRVLTTDLGRAIPDSRALASAIVDLYGEIFLSLVVVEPFYGSCTVFFPPHLSLDLVRVCSESGYIHSCGINVYAGSLDDADEGGLTSALTEHLDRTASLMVTGGPSTEPILTKPLKVFLTAYAHEDFTQHDRDDASDLRDGLDDVKVFVEKYYLANKRFASVLQHLKERLGDRIRIPDPGDFRKEHKKARQGGDIDPDHTVWLIIDRQVVEHPPFRGVQRFLICYDQFYKNENPFHVFDENKPAWLSHTTIPHTLAGAMLNITRPWWPAGRMVNVGDPFSGTGTIWLECTKLRNVIPRCGDIEPMARLMAEDNLRFFSESAAFLKSIETRLEKLVASLEEGRFWAPKALATSPRNHADEELYKGALELFETLDVARADSSVNIPVGTVEALKVTDFLCRILFYVALRTFVRHAAAFRRGSEEWTKAYVSELSTLRRQMSLLIELKTREEGGTATHPDSFFARFSGSYSVSTAVSTQRLRSIFDDRRSWPSVEELDACKPSGHPIDVVVTDPPYGFNTDSDYGDLAALYARSLRAMISSLDDGGQVVLCLADKSHTGRRIPVFSTKGWIVQHVLAEAQARGLEAILEAQVLPNPGQLFRQPYYWESERALRRAVLHFRFRRVGPAPIKEAGGRAS